MRVAKSQVETRQAISGLFMLSEEALQDFKKIWKEEFGEEIPDDLAVEEAVNLLTFCDAIYRPIRKDWLDKNEDGKDR